MNRKVTRIISLMAVTSCIAVAVTSCEPHDKNSPGVEFMPDMYRSPSLEGNMAYVTIKDGKLTTDTLQANRLPAAGSIARGYMPYAYANDTAGYANAGRSLRNPLSKNDLTLKQGEELYGKFCDHCHGATGQGDGAVGLKLPGAPPAYTSPALKNLPEGKIFHVITYGKGLMGSHASQLTKDERWKITHYVQKLQNPEGTSAKPATPAADSAATVTAKAPETK